MFAVMWHYLESKTDFCLFGPFKSYDAADAWGKGRSGKMKGSYEVHKIVDPR